MDKIFAPIKKRILEYVDFKGIEKKKFFNSIEVSASNYRSSSLRSEVGGDVIAKISSIYQDLNIDWLISGEGTMLKQHSDLSAASKKLDRITEASRKYGKLTAASQIVSEPALDYETVPIYDLTASASVVQVFGDLVKAVPIDYLTIPHLPKCDGAIYISGDSMYPLLKSGDLVLFKKLNNKQNIVWGEMYVIYINNDGDEFFFVKYIQKSDRQNFIKLVSQNVNHESVEFPIDSIIQLALVKASVRINSAI